MWSIRCGFASLARRSSSSIRAVRFNTTKTYPKNIELLADEISNLNLIQVADLSALLKTKLNLPDIAPVAAASAAATPAAGASTEDANDDKAKQDEQSVFAVKLDSFEPTSKPKVIKQVKALLGLSLVDSKKFVESAPKLLKDGLGKEDAQNLKDTFEKLGAKITLE